VLLAIDLGTTNLTLAYTMVKSWARAGAWQRCTIACRTNMVYRSLVYCPTPATDPATEMGCAWRRLCPH